MASKFSPTSSSSSESPPETSSYLEHLMSKYGGDSSYDKGKSIVEMAELSEDDLPITNFDFESVWNQVRDEIAAEGDDGLNSAEIEKLVAMNQDLSISQMNFRVSKEELFEGLEGDALRITPMDNLREILYNLTPSRKGDGENNSGHSDGPVVKKMKGDSKSIEKPVLSTKSKREPVKHKVEKQYALVHDVTTKQRTVIALARGQEIPPGFEIASVHEDLPILQGSLVDFPADAIQNAIREVVGPKVDLEPVRSPPQKSSATLISLSDFMTAEMQKNDNTRLVYKKRSVTPSKVASLVSKAAAGDVIIEGLCGTESNLNSSPKGGSIGKGSNDTLDLSPVLAGSSVAKTSSGSFSKSWTSSSNLVDQGRTKRSSLTIKSVRGATSTSELDMAGQDANQLFGCKICGETFPCSSDNLFRKHLLIKHDVEVTDTKYFEEQKVNPVRFRRCKKCHQGVLNNLDEHQQKCLPGIPSELAFEEYNVPTKMFPIPTCGLCSKMVGTRYELKAHVDEVHSEVGKTMIVDPDYRCARCLKRFDESVALVKHCATCKDGRPRVETLLDLAKSLAYCDFCAKRHPTIEDSVTCYLEKDIRRCILCLAIFKDKNLFNRHLQDFHSLQFQPKVTWCCPVCIGKERDKISVISQHVITVHLAPLLLTSNQGLPMPRPIFNSSLQKQPGVSVSSGTPVFSTKVISTSGNTSTVHKVPDLRPIYAKPVNPNVPQGIVINTTRLNPTTFAPASHYRIPISTTSGSPAASAATASAVVRAAKTMQLVRAGPTAQTSAGLMPVQVGDKTVLVPVQATTKMSTGQAAIPGVLRHPSSPHRAILIRPTTTGVGNVTTSPSVIRLPIATSFAMAGSTTSVAMLRQPQVSGTSPTAVSTARPQMITLVSNAGSTSTTSSSKPVVRLAGTAPTVVSVSDDPTKSPTRTVFVGDKVYHYQVVSNNAPVGGPGIGQGVMNSPGVRPVLLRPVAGPRPNLGVRFPVVTTSIKSTSPVALPAPPKVLAISAPPIPVSTVSPSIAKASEQNNTPTSESSTKNDK